MRAYSSPPADGPAATEPVDVLVVLPHPDDESSATGGLLAKCAADGLRTGVIICTGGEEGEIHDPALAEASARLPLAAIRGRELHAACRVLGVAELRLLGYRDSGMAGSAANAHPAAFVNAGLDAAADRLATLIRELRPRVVVTENEDGTYGHPDHRRCHQVAVHAWERAADPGTRIAGAPWQPARLYALAPVWAGHAQVLGQLRQLGLDTSSLEAMLGRRRDERASGTRAAVTLSLDVSLYTTIQQAALRCHRSQIPTDSLFMRLSPELRRRAFATIHLTRLRPRPAPGERDADLLP